MSGKIKTNSLDISSTNNTEHIKRWYFLGEIY